MNLTHIYIEREIEKESHLGKASHLSRALMNHCFNMLPHVFFSELTMDDDLDGLGRLEKYVTSEHPLQR